MTQAVQEKRRTEHEPIRAPRRPPPRRRADRRALLRAARRPQRPRPEDLVEHRRPATRTAGSPSAGSQVTRLAEEFGTPAYILDEADFRDRCRAWRRRLRARGRRVLRRQGLPLQGRGALAARGGAQPRRVLRHRARHRAATRACPPSASPSTATTRARPRSGGPSRRASGRIVLDSFQEIVRRRAHRRGSWAPSRRRSSGSPSGVEAHTHEFIATAHEDQKFGIALAGGLAAEAVRRALKLDGLELVGIHSHIGSQIFDMAGFEVSARRVVAAAGRGPRRARRRAARDRPGRRPRHRVHLRRRPARAARDRRRRLPRSSAASATPPG